MPSLGVAGARPATGRRSADADERAVAGAGVRAGSAWRAAGTGLRHRLQPASSCPGAGFAEGGCGRRRHVEHCLRSRPSRLRPASATSASAAARDRRSSAVNHRQGVAADGAGFSETAAAARSEEPVLAAVQGWGGECRPPARPAAIQAIVARRRRRSVRPFCLGGARGGVDALARPVLETPTAGDADAGRGRGRNRLRHRCHARGACRGSGPGSGCPCRGRGGRGRLRPCPATSAPVWWSRCKGFCMAATRRSRAVPSAISRSWRGRCRPGALSKELLLRAGRRPSRRQPRVNDDVLVRPRRRWFAARRGRW